MDTFSLAKWGFTTIRNLLEGRIPGGSEAAKVLAEALHNLPEPDNEFCVDMTIERLARFKEKFPEASEGMSSIVIERTST